MRMPSAWRMFAPAVAVILNAMSPFAAAVAPGRAPAEVLILGLYHFANPGLDIVKSEVVDVLSPSRQREIEAVVDSLARFRPTRIAIEARAGESEAGWNARYAAYRRDRAPLGRNEIEQLGFRLAARFAHERLFAVDHAGAWPFDAVLAYAREKDAPFMQWFEGSVREMTALHEHEQRELDLAAILRAMNDPARLVREHGWYVRILDVGAGDGYAGAELVAAWYARNLRIFADIQRLAAPGERVLVLIGQGHAPILRELARSAPALRLVDPRDYL